MADSLAFSSSQPNDSMAAGPNGPDSDTAVSLARRATPFPSPSNGWPPERHRHTNTRACDTFCRSHPDTLRIDLYRATNDAEETFDAIWNKAKTADPARDGWHKVADCMEGRSIRMPLEEFMSDHESTASTLRELLFPTGDADNGSGQVDRP